MPCCVVVVFNVAISALLVATCPLAKAFTAAVTSASVATAGSNPTVIVVPVSLTVTLVPPVIVSPLFTTPAAKVTVDDNTPITIAVKKAFSALILPWRKRLDTFTFPCPLASSDTT